MTAPAPVLAAELPPGTVGRARQLLSIADRRLRARGGAGLDTGEPAAEELLWLPRLLEPDWPGPTPPLAVPGGWVHVDVSDDDAPTFDLLRRTMPSAGPEALAAAAQEWRLPVTPYRLRSPRWPAQPGLDERDDPSPSASGLAGRRVVDLTSLWAGPLCTSLLAAHGAEVTKVDPDCRPDGFRARPALYQRLNGAKAIIDLDLRRDDDRARFEELVRGADLLVHSFSRRVMPNLGYDPDRLRQLNPRLATLAITAFPAGSPEQDWLAYGPGVHAASGLGLASPHRPPRPAPVAYPDALAGLAAFAVALSLLGAGPAHAEVSLAGVVAPVVGAP